MSLWPVTMPPPLSSGYRIEAGGQTVDTPMESGAARVRRVVTAATDVLTCRWQVIAEQRAGFEAFYLDPAGGALGGAWFTLPLGGACGLADHTARFLEPPVIRPISGAWWSIEATLEVRDRPVLTEELTRVLGCCTPAEVAAAAALADTYAQETLATFDWSYP